MPLRTHKRHLETLYRRYNRAEWIDPDPLMLVREYSCVRDREIAALLAGSLAYGRVQQILKSAGIVLDAMNPHPARWLVKTPPRTICKTFDGFKHRFATGEHVSNLLIGARTMLRDAGSLHAGFLACDCPKSESVQAGLTEWTRQIRRFGPCGHLLADPSRNSACKRLHLMLRWLVRKDAVDPGGWTDVDPARLIVPLDVHMHRIATRLGATQRKSADRKTAFEVTRAFSIISPDDPVRFDFPLTRFGIHPALNAS